MPWRRADMIIAEEVTSEPFQPTDGVTGRMRKHLKTELAATDDKIVAVAAELHASIAHMQATVEKLLDQTRAV